MGWTENSILLEVEIRMLDGVCMTRETNEMGHIFLYRIKKSILTCKIDDQT